VSWFRKNSAVVVLPLQAISNDDRTARFAAGTTEDIITDLARFRDIDIIAANSARSIAKEQADVREIGRTLGVNYIVRGTIQREQDQMRISAQLIDAVNGASIWSERWDRPFSELFAIQDEISQRVAGAIGSSNSSVAIAVDELNKLKHRAPASLTAYDHYLLAVEARALFTKDAIFAGVDHATKAIKLDPTYARAYAIRATHYGMDFETAMEEMEADARKAVELAPDDAEALGALAWYLVNRGQNLEAESEIRAALAANPNNVNVMHMGFAILASNGHTEEGVALADRVLKIDPLANAGTLNTIKDAYFFARRFDDLINVISRIPENARSRGSRLFLAMGYALIGHTSEAEAAKKHSLRNIQRCPPNSC
jgi:TolB-like protein/Tfp pilus assembly protein PilF